MIGSKQKGRNKDYRVNASGRRYVWWRKRDERMERILKMSSDDKIIYEQIQDNGWK